jgi:uncharacterized membrane protein YgaE (UPF0421/DUF939 family)
METDQEIKMFLGAAIGLFFGMTLERTFGPMTVFLTGLICVFIAMVLIIRKAD